VSGIKIERLSYWYPDTSQPALVDINLQLAPASWVLVQGDTGSGKSTLLRCISGACPTFYGGRLHGRVEIAGKSIDSLSQKERLQSIGYLGQDPEAATVYATVSHEVAFALENQGVPPAEMHWRIGEVLDAVGLANLFDAPMASLSGGSRQRVQLAAVLVHQPQVLLLDEPTSQLDPVAAEELLDVLHRVNEEFGMTVVMCEHRLEKAYARVNRVLYMEQGQLLANHPPHEMIQYLRDTDRLDMIPPLARLSPRAATKAFLTVREVRLSLRGYDGTRSHQPSSGCQTPDTADLQPLHPSPSVATENGLIFHRVSVSYPETNARALQNVSCQFAHRKVTAVIGPNGSGKSTLLRVISGLQSADSGKFGGCLITPAGITEPGKQRWQKEPKLTRKTPFGIGDARVGYVPQNPNELLSQETVWAEIKTALSLRGISGVDANLRTEKVLEAFGLLQLKDNHPRDISGGERLRTAVASIVVCQPQLLLLDEPTRGLDATHKRLLGERLQQGEQTVVIATHDMDFVAEHADDVLFLVQGRVAMQGSPNDVFRQALYYAPAIARALRDTDATIQCLSEALQAGWAR